MAIRAWLQHLKRRRLDDQDFQEEIRAHLAIATEERMAEGADRETARHAAMKDFGNVLLTTEAVRRVWTPRWLDVLSDQVADVHYAIRSLAKQPAFSLTVVGVLALGIGLNAAVFTMLKSLTLSPLAGVDRSARLVALFGETGAGRFQRLSYPDYQYVRDHDRAFSGLFGSGVVTASLGRGRSARYVWGELVTWEYFQVLGVGAEHGRTLLPSDEIAPGRHPVVVISDGLWRRDFGADPGILGATIEVNNYPLTVVGVADRTFHGTIVGYEVDVFVPVMMAAQVGADAGIPRAAASDLLSDRRAGLLIVQGYLKEGTTLASTAAEAAALGAAIARDRPLEDAAQRLRVVPFWQSPNGAQTYALPAVVVLSAMGLLVLMIACMNIAGLVLVRGLSRRGELAVRLALGATRMRIVRLLILENLVLAVPGALLGLLIAWHGVPPLVDYVQMLGAPMRFFFNIEIDGVVIGFSVLAACGSALLFGFVPALRISRIDLVSVINEDASPRGAARGRLRSALLVAQVAVSLLLLVGAGLVTRSLEAARRAHPGFEAAHATSVSMDVRQNGYDEAAGRVFYRHLLDAVRADPGVEAATLAAYVPLGVVDTRAQRVTIEGYEPQRGEDLAFLSNTVGSDYFRTLRIGLMTGRAFEERDDETTAPVVIVNNTLARRFWGGAANAIGRRVRTADGAWRTVIGVAADVKYSRLNEAPRPYLYLPFLQSYRSNMILHTRGPAASDVLMDQARAQVTALDPDLPILYARSLEQSTRGGVIILEFLATMLFVFGAAGMALAGMGTYGLVSYTVQQSTHEIGIRMALGASGLAVVRRFLARGLRLGAIGAGLGLSAAFGVSWLLRSVLFGVSATDGVSFARALAIVLGGVAVASLVPAWRASRTDPLNALRHQ